MIAINLFTPLTPDERKKARARMYMRRWYRQNRAKWVAYEVSRRPHRAVMRRISRAQNLVGEMLSAAKQRAKAKGLPFELVRGDIEIPELCPVLGIPLARTTTGKPGANSPSLDRIIPAYGYVRGNVRVISHKANTIKSDATLEELRAVVRYLESAK